MYRKCIVRSTIHFGTIHNTLWHYTQYTFNDTQYTFSNTLYTFNYTQYTFSNTKYTFNNTRYTLALFTIQFQQYTIHFWKYTIHFQQYTIHSSKYNNLLYIYYTLFKKPFGGYPFFSRNFEFLENLQKKHVRCPHFFNESTQRNMELKIFCRNWKNKFSAFPKKIFPSSRVL